MKYKTLCRLLVKLLGVYFLGLGVTSIWRGVIQFVEYFQQGLSSMRWELWGSLILYPIADIGVGLYLFTGGKWVVDKLIPSNRPYCHECGYDLTGSVGNICVECGTPFKPVISPEPHH